MVRWFAPLLLCLALSLPAAAQVPPEILRATVRVQVALGGGCYGGGSGTVVRVRGGKAAVLTCKHVVPSAGEITVWFPPAKAGDSPRRSPAKFLGADAESDLSLVEADAPPGLKALPVAAGDAPAGESVWQAGYPSGVLAQRWGAVLPGRSWCGRTPNVHARITVASGDSGSGLFTGNHELCGVVWGGLPGKASATGVPDVRRFVKAVCGD